MWLPAEWWLRCPGHRRRIIGAFKVPFLRTGFRMVVFSIIIMIVVLFFRRGLMGDKELSDVARSLRARLSGKSKKKEAAQMSEKILRLENITMQFGGVVAVNNLNLEVKRGGDRGPDRPQRRGQDHGLQRHHRRVPAHQRRGVVPAGRRSWKTTPRARCSKLYKGEHAGEYTHALAPTPDKITQMGMARTFQNIRLWKAQTVFDNVLIGQALPCHAATCSPPPSV